MKIKVCGITSVEQLSALEAMDVDYAGFIFYSKSARYAGEKLEGHQKEIKTFSIQKVGVFVNEELEEVKRKIGCFGLSAVQLHGDESAEYCLSLMPLAQVVKVFRLKGTEDVQALLEPFKNACHYFLFDTNTKEYGGSGKQFNWKVLEETKLNKPFFLSGGIGPEDVEKIKMFQNPFVHAVDINSCFEKAPGEKDMKTVAQFVNSLKEASWKK